MVARILEGSYSEADEHNLKALTALGAILTASAGREALCLDVSFPQSSLSQVTKFVAQRLSRVEIEDLEIDELRRIQLATLDSLRRDGDWLAHAVFWATAYHGTPYSLPAIGSDSTIGRINSGDVGSFSGMFITRGNYILGLSGPLTAAEAAAIDAQLQELLLSGVPSTRIPPTNPPSGLGVRIVEAAIRDYAKRNRKFGGL